MWANAELWPGQDSDVINELPSLRSCCDVRGSQRLINFTVITIQQTFPPLEDNELRQSVSLCGVFNCGGEKWGSLQLDSVRTDKELDLRREKRSS